MIEQGLTRPLQFVFDVNSRDGLSKADGIVTLAQQLNVPSANMCRGNSNSSRLLGYHQKDMWVDVTKFEAIMGMPVHISPKNIYSVCKEYENAAP